MTKSAAFGVVDLGIALGVDYALSGNLAAARAVTLVEPEVKAVQHRFLDR